MARGKNLSKDDLEDVSIWEDISKSKNGSHEIKLNDIKISIKCLNEKQKELKKSIEEKEIVISIGVPGTGKTYLSLLTALHLLKTQPKYKKLILIKSVQTIKGEDVGYLPGSMMEKMQPFMWSFTGNLDKIFGDKKITQQLLNSGTIEIVPIAYCRGITLDNCMLDDTTILLEDDTSINIEEFYEKFLSKIDEDFIFNVKSFNFETQKIENKEITQISKQPILEDCYEIQLEDGRILHLTENHQLFVKDKGYIKISDLTENDTLINC